MKVCLIGYGKMGKAIEPILVERGHELSGIVTRSNSSQLADFLSQSDVAIEFTDPESAFDNLLSCFEHQVPVVSGTTGWLAQWDDLIHILQETDGTMLWASNFSIGVNVLFEVNRLMAKIMSRLPEYQIQVEEIHHIHKKDKPSGTAVSLINDIMDKHPIYKSWILDPQEPNADQLSVLAKREESVVGYHKVRFKSPIDQLEISHEAFTREGFAKGAVFAAEWLKGKKGLYTMSQALGF
ncbi:MAG: 4-hydroxy-tetrahydrodipicolinate reductase [Saprospiraceae bacterium]|nr:4-hydroxy-tetrahydrodipicolinate reductase [Candidatus Vicinibacter proximus]